MINKKITHYSKEYRILTLLFTGLLSLLLVSGCNLFDVENEGEIMEEVLDNENAVGALVAGAGSDLSVAYGYLLNVPLATGLITDEIQHTGSYTEFKDLYYADRIIQNDQSFMNEFYSYCAVARWTTDNAVTKIKEIYGDAANSSVELAEVLVYCGFAHIAMADVFGDIPIDGGALVPQMDVYQRAIDRFTEAITVGTAAGASDWVEIATAGRARAYYSREEVAMAAQDAVKISNGFCFNAEFADNTDVERNWLYWANITRMEVSVSPEIVALYEETNDPRIKATFADVGGDGVHDCYVQEKYTSYADPIRLVGWQEMQLIQAEAKMNGGDLAGAVTHINDVRAEAGMEARPASGDAAEVKAWLIHERRVELFFEGRRMPDCRHFGLLDVIKNDPPFIPLSSWEVDNNENID